MGPGDAPIPRSTSIRIVRHIFEAVDVLLDVVGASAVSTARLAAGGDELLDLTEGMPGVEIHRIRLIALALTILDDGIIPLELWTEELSLAFALTEDYDYLMELVRLWP